MILVLSLTAATYFVVACVAFLRVQQTAHYQSRVHAAVHSPYVWAGLLTLTIIPVAHTGHLSWPAVIVWPVIAFALATLLLNLASYFLRHLRWQFPPLVTTGILPAAWLAALIVAGWFLWTLSVAAMPPILWQAEKRGQTIESARKGMQAKLTDMHTSLAQFQIPSVQENDPYQYIRTSAQDLIDLADTLIKQHAALVAYHDKYLHELTDAPELFLAAAQVWREYAKEDRALGLTDICDGYEAMAVLWEAYAQALKEADSDPFSIKELDAVMVFVRRARLMLERIATNTPLDTAADFLSRKAQFEANLRLFIEHFDNLRTAINTLTKQIRDMEHHEVPGSPQAAYERLLGSSSEATGMAPDSGATQQAESLPGN